MDSKKEGLGTLNVVVGAGAVGLFLAKDLLAAQQSIVLLNKTILPFPIRVESKNEEWLMPEEITPVPFTEISSLFTLFGDYKNYVIYLTVPPDAIFTTSEFLLTNFLSQLKTSATFVFCNNGFVLNNTLHLLRDTKINLFRALFFAGLQRTVSEKGTRVIHIDGTKVVYGPFSKNNSTLFSPAGVSLIWELAHDIHFIEAAKFFINFCLGYFIGGQRLPNVSLYTLTTQEEIENMAVHFVKLFNNKFDSRAIVDLLNETIRNTALNINSISLALHRNNPKPWNELLFQLQTLVENSGDEFLYWNQFLKTHVG